MESELHIPDNPFIVRYHINLALIRKMKYTSIKKERDTLKKILYMFVCQDDNLENLYEGDKLMEDVIKVAREISGQEKIPLYLSEDEIRKLDREEAVEEGYTSGYESGKNDGIEQKQNEMVINFYKNGVSLELISKSSGLSIDEVNKIINEK